MKNLPQFTLDVPGGFLVFCVKTLLAGMIMSLGFFCIVAIFWEDPHDFIESHSWAVGVPLLSFLLAGMILAGLMRIKLRIRFSESQEPVARKPINREKYLRELLFVLIMTLALHVESRLFFGEPSPHLVYRISGMVWCLTGGFLTEFIAAVLQRRESVAEYIMSRIIGPKGN